MSVPVTTSQTEPAGPGLLASLWQRFGHLVHELGKFGVVGSSTFVLDLTVSNLLLDALGPFWSATVSMAIAATVAFLGNRFWTWRHRERSGLHREYLLYFAFNLGGLLISLACVWLTWSVLGHFWPATFHSRLAYNVAKNGFGMVLGTFFRFWSYRKFVFPEVARAAGDEVRA